MKTNITLLVTIILLSVKSFSQAPNWVWAKSAGGSDKDASYSVTTDASGNIFITGFFQSPTITFGTTTLTNTGISNIFIVKYDALGNVIWAKSAGGTTTAWCYSVTTDASGNVFITGSFGSPTITFGTNTLTNANNTGSNSDIFIVKYDALGNVIWAKSAGGTAADGVTGITTDASGNVYITGGFQSPTISFGTASLTNSGINNVFIVKYDALGNVIWAKSAGGTNIQGTARSVTTDASGNVFITGDFQSPTINFGTITLTNADNTNNSMDIFIVKYDAFGNVIWAKSAGGIADDVSNSVITDASGNVFIAGYFSNPTITFGSSILTNVGYNNIFIVKYDVLGNVIWAKSAGGTTNDYSASVATDASGNVFIAGYFQSPTITFDTTTLINAGNTDIFISKYDALGNVLWAKSAGGTDADFPHSVTTDVSGNIFITGSFSSATITFGTTTLNNFVSGNQDIFLAKLEPNTNSVSQLEQANFVSIYPNPFTSLTTITFSSEQTNTTIKVTDILGKEIKALNFRGKQCIIEKGTMESGVYFVTITDEKKNVVNRKVVVE